MKLSGVKGSFDVYVFILFIDLHYIQQYLKGNPQESDRTGTAILFQSHTIFPSPVVQPPAFHAIGSYESRLPYASTIT
jgi:hypothetical protein